MEESLPQIPQKIAYIIENYLYLYTHISLTPYPLQNS